MDNHKILIATDFSQKSFKIIEQVLHYIHNKNSKVFILHVVESSIFSQVKDVEAIGHKSFKILQEHFSVLKESQFYCVEGKIDEQIAYFVDKLDISLVVLGSSGERSHVNKFFLGSNTKDIVRNVNTPSLIIKSARELKFETIMIPTDLSLESKKYINEVAQFFSTAKIKIFYSYSIPFENRLNFYGLDKNEISLFQQNIQNVSLQEAQDFFDSLNIKNDLELVTKEGSLDAQEFAKEASELKCDLIAVHTTGNFSFFAFDLVEHSHRNILIKKMM
ncbi:MAG: universal stress protein [archaeon]|jgi:nucleotide-binding universal stress UspA family protein